MLERTLDETLRRYPPAWVGPRRAVRDVELGRRPDPGRRARALLLVGDAPPRRAVPGPVRASSPDRFLPERAARLPRGAYVPFGGGSRMCLGKRFGQTELRALAAVLLTRVRLEPDLRRPVQVVTSPTLGPKGGLRFTVRARP